MGSGDGGKSTEPGIGQSPPRAEVIQERVAWQGEAYRTMTDKDGEKSEDRNHHGPAPKEGCAQSGEREQQRKGEHAERQRALLDVLEHRRPERADFLHAVAAAVTVLGGSLFVVTLAHVLRRARL